MTRPFTNGLSRIDEPWPVEGLEPVDQCPYCHSKERSEAHRDVQDWSFYAAPGKWTYWACTQCCSLYLSPRPTVETLALAYATYYTHQGPGESSLIQRAKWCLENEFWSHSLRTDLRPRLHLPSWLRWLLIPLRSRLVEPFQLTELAKRPTGRLVDVGCGSGDLLVVARQLGWQAVGLEVDPAAVRAARARGLEVLEGSYECLSSFGTELDCIICSHVLEHVHRPLDLLLKIAESLKPGGVLLLSLPNATSLLRSHFGNDWRGLEAPRHLTIPSMRQLAATLCRMGFSVEQRPLTRLWTAAQSLRIRRRGVRLRSQDRAAARKLSIDVVPSSTEMFDFVEFVCTKGPQREP